MVESIKSFFLKFISGRLGLATTFWLCGALVALTLNFLTSHVTTLWQLILVTIAMIVHLILIVIAVWNASKWYQGRQIWKWLARLIAILNIAKWLWYLPTLVITLSSVIGFPIYSDKYWVLDSRTHTCEHPEYFDTPEQMAERKRCQVNPHPNGEFVIVQCPMSTGVYLFTFNQQDCQKHLNLIYKTNKK